MNNCHFFQINNLLGKKWTYVILQQVARHGDQGFNTLFKNIPNISPKILAEKLSKLQEKGLISKNQSNNISIGSIYTFTEKGKELLALYDVLKEWSNKYSSNNWDCTARSCADCDFHL